jgi:hypothetical protein
LSKSLRSIFRRKISGQNLRKGDDRLKEIKIDEVTILSVRKDQNWEMYYVSLKFRGVFWRLSNSRLQAHVNSAFRRRDALFDTLEEAEDFLEVAATIVSNQVLNNGYWIVDHSNGEPRPRKMYNPNIHGVS